MNTSNPTRWAVAVAIVASGMMTAACGTGTTATDPPPAEASIYPPADVPEVRPDAASAAAVEHRAAHNEENLRRAGRWFATQ